MTHRTPLPRPGGRQRRFSIRLPLSLRTRNFVGTIFGGAMFGALDPLYMIMLIQNLPKGTVVWDKEGTIRFKKPGRSTLYARALVTQEELDTIAALLQESRSIERVYALELTDAAGVVHAVVEKTIYIRRAEA